MDTPHNRFNDIFHGFGDDEDERNDPYVDFDNPYREIDSEADQIGVPAMIEVATAVEQEEEEPQQQLSQKLSQLSASDAVPSTGEQPAQSIVSTAHKRPALTPTTPVEPVKKTKPDMPNYLSVHSPLFEQKIRPLLNQETASLTEMEYLRHIAVLKHKLAVANSNTTLWTVYLRSGMGQLTSHDAPTATSQELCIWPDDVKLTMMEKRAVPTTIMRLDEISSASCQQYVHKILREFHDQTSIYQAQLQSIQQRLRQPLTSAIETAMDQLIEQHGIGIHRLRVESKIIPVEYDYRDQLIKADFHRETPSEYQRKKFESLTEAKYEQEKAKYEVAMLKQRLAHHCLPETLAALRIPPPVVLPTIQNEVERQRLTDRCEKILQRAKSDMMVVYISAIEAKHNEYTMKFEAEMAQLKQEQRTVPSDERFTQRMMDILERRFRNIDERLERLYQVKLHFFEQAPTITN